MTAAEGITVVRSDRRTLAIEVKADGRVFIRAPYGCPDRTISDFAAANEDWLKRALERVEARKSAYTEPSPERVRELKASAKKTIPERVKHFSTVTGLVPTAIRITSARTRFGSCSGKNSVSFSWRLMEYPSECIDYVVLHELAHIKYHNHSKKFYDLIARYMPDHRERRKRLLLPPECPTLSGEGDTESGAAKK